jgi:hypothetical protein
MMLDVIELKHRFLSGKEFTDILKATGAFKFFDKNGDGEVEIDEVVEMLDVDGDKKVSWDELRNAFILIMQKRGIEQANSDYLNIGSPPPAATAASKGAGCKYTKGCDNTRYLQPETGLCTVLVFGQEGCCARGLEECYLGSCMLLASSEQSRSRA